MSYHRNLVDKDLHAPSRETIVNATASTITKLKVVRVSGMGTFPQIDIADPNLYQNFGVATDDILVGQVGKVCCLGFMFGLDTSAWPVGTTLFSDSNGDLSIVALGAPVATVIKQDAVTGVLYVTAISDQITPPSGVDWGLSGNNISFGSFLGTNNNQALVIKTNGQQQAILDTSGRFGLGQPAPTRQFEVKSHAGVDSSGVQMESFTVSTTSNTYQNIYTIALIDPSSLVVEFTVLGKDSITGDVCSFKRLGSFYRNAGNVQLMPQGWQSSYTSKTDNAFNVSYTINPTNIIIKVKAATTNLTTWVGNVVIQELKL